MRAILGIDIETYSPVPLPKTGVYRYVDTDDFEILLFSYAYDDGPVQTVDMACGEQLPENVLADLENPDVIKVAYNAQFERVCLSKYLGHWLDPHQWRCTAVMAAYLTMPARLSDAAVALGATEQKMEEGKDLIRFFSVPCRATKANDGRTRNLPEHAPDKWAVYKQYNAQDVETERAVRKACEAHPMPESEWELYALDQLINDRGVRVDKQLVKQAMRVDSEFTEAAYQRAKNITGLENPGSVAQLKTWLADQDVPMESLAKKLVQEKAANTEGLVSELLSLRLELSKTSIKKYETIARCVCRDGRVHGMLQFYGANRTGRWAGRLLQVQNLPQNHLEDLDTAAAVVKTGDTELVEMLYGSVPNTLSELIRTALIPKQGYRFIVADFSAIEARVLAWLAGEEWVLEEFRGAGKIYEATASRMYHVPKESIVKGNPNYEYRQKGKQATLSCGYGGGIGALKNMGAKMPEDEMQPLVDAWRAANPHIVGLWNAMDRAMRKVIREHSSVRVGKIRLYWKDEKMLIRLPSGRELCYLSPRKVTNRFGSDGIGYLAPAANGQLVVQETFGGKIVENCIARGTLVLTDKGLVPIERINDSHLLWDGEAFIFHEGLLCKGEQKVIRVDGLLMTENHRILTDRGWMACGESDGLNWANVSLPDRLEAGGKQSTRKDTVAVSVHMRENNRGCNNRFDAENSSNPVMRLHAATSDPRKEHCSRYVASSSLCCMEFDEATLPESESQSISQLWWQRNYSLPGMADQLCEVLGRHGINLFSGIGVGPHRQQFRLFPPELQMGFSYMQWEKQEKLKDSRFTDRENDCFRTERENRNRRDDSSVQTGSQLAQRIAVYQTGLSVQVYDIRNCGPRHRFTVFDPVAGEYRIVSNCTQATARDILAHAMLNLEAYGYRIVFHVHDECVMEMPEGTGSVEEACAIMGQTPEWCSDLPLRADGYECRSYRKA